MRQLKRRNLFTGGMLEVIANVQSTRAELVESRATKGFAQDASSQDYFQKSAKSTTALPWRILKWADVDFRQERCSAPTGL